MSFWSTLSFNDANSPLMEQMIFFHDHSMLILTLIMIFISYIMVKIMMNNYFCLTLHEGQDLEIIWTVLPMILLIFIALPSLRLLYLMEESFNNHLTVKIIGHQWYWSYEYPEFNLNFDSFMIPSTENNKSHFRLLDVDNRMLIPMKTNCRLLLTSTDVIHAWTIPSLSIKMDAVPGRLNQMNLFSSRPGLIFGQCSEICGANHSFMPITLETTSNLNFINWIKKYNKF